MVRKMFGFFSIFVVLVLLLGSTGGAWAKAPGGDGPDAQAIALGKPGTVFRYVSTQGVSGKPYFDDPDHLYLNSPMALNFDSGGNLYVVEENGSRLLKFDGTGGFLWQAGQTGGHAWWAYGMSWPKDAAVAPDGTVWVPDNDIFTQFDGSTGQLLHHYPPDWGKEVSDDHLRFRHLRGITFDKDGRMYVSDADRHRIEVFAFDGGVPQYAAMLGETDQPGDDDTHFGWPSQIVVDSHYNLFVADMWNARVQKCSPDGDTWPWGWTCTTFHGTGGFGGGDDQLGGWYNLGIDASDNLYIADQDNGRIKKVAPDQSFVIFTTSFPPTDVAVSPAQDFMLVASMPGEAVIKLDMSGQNPTIFRGVEKVPYLTDHTYLNGPRGIEIDSAGALIVVEEQGQRMLKFKKDGSLAWSIGDPGRPDGGQPQGHMDSPRAVAADRQGNIWVAGGGNHVRIYDSLTGQYKQDFDQGGFDWKNPADPANHYRFGCASGIAIDPAGNLYVADNCTQRVMMYNKSRVFVRQLGEATVPGQDNAHFNQPWGIAVDPALNLYVADHDNCRVQKFDKTGAYKMTFSIGLWCGDRLDQLGGPSDVAVNGQGKVYVTEEWNNRVTVYDKTGAYLTGMGTWGTGSSQFHTPDSLAIDAAGNLFIADTFNHRIQKFAPGVPYWAQVNINGFGWRENNDVESLAVFNNQLYAGVENYAKSGAQIWRLGKMGWEQVMGDGFGDGMNVGIVSLVVYNGYLYAGTKNGTYPDFNDTNGGEIWRSADGLTWQMVMKGGFGDVNNAQIYLPGTMGGKLCASTFNRASGAELWCSATGEPGSWSRDLLLKDLSYSPNWDLPTLVEFNGAVYLGPRNWNVEAGNGAQVWRKVGSGPWQPVSDPGFGDSGNSAVDSLVPFQGYLYAATAQAGGGNAQIYRCQACAGSDWQEVTPAGLPPNTLGDTGLQVVGKNLYVAISNFVTGLEVWGTSTGLTWKQVGAAGLGDSNNMYIWSHFPLVSFKNSLYLGTADWVATGGEVWKYCPTKKVCK